MRTKVVGHLVLPQFPFKVRRFSRAQFSAKSKFWETVTKTLINQKRLKLRMNAAPFQNLESKRNLLVCIPTLQVIKFCQNFRLKFGDFLALNFRQNLYFWETVTKRLINQKRLELQLKVAPFWNLENQNYLVVVVPNF